MKFPSVGLVAFTLSLSSLFGGTWAYDFTTQGIDPTFWSTVNTSGSFTFTPSGAGVTVATTGTDPSFNTGKLSLNLAQFSSLTDFSISATFTGGDMTGYLHQIQLETNWASGGLLMARSNESGETVNLYAGAGPFAFQGVGAAEGVSSPATFTMTRNAMAVTASASWNGVQWWWDFTSVEPLTGVYLALNNNNGATDANSVTWQSFSITSPAIPEPSAYAVLVGLGALVLVLLQRRRRPTRLGLTEVK